MISIKVNRRILFRGELGEWINKPPDEFKEVIKPGVKAKPYMKAIMVTLADSAITGANLTVNVTTRKGGWTMVVEQ